MPRRRVKICGITRADDARLAAELGADAIGLNFHPQSPRAIHSLQIADIVGKLPAFVTVVGLFVDPLREDVEAVLNTGLIQCLQFHGNETVDFCSSFGVPFIKAVRVKGLAEARSYLKPFQGKCSVILDAYVKGAVGGTGESFDWSVAGEIVRDGQNPIILAGGLRPENVAEAIKAVRPYGVDVSSGVEMAPGVKDPEKVKRFIAAAAD
ncbi:MAG: phosphoribosylanthranilate isomerase [Gammaproteobacteria bacterium]|nr:phosphoribosylanthranilate isomerase [Gammaproteobacteria bacterium]